MNRSVARHNTRSIAFILFDDLTLMDVAGPAEVFASANGALGPGTAYRLQTYSLDGATVHSEAGFRIQPDTALPDQLSVDTLIIPGGAGLRDPAVLTRIAPVLQRSRLRCRRLVSICTGAYALAESGLLDGHRVTTHWRFAEDLARRYPRLQVDARVLFSATDGIATSAGISAGIDLALSLVEEDHGHAVALAVARELVVYLRRSGNQSQYSEPLQLQAGQRDRIGDLVSWMLTHPGADLHLDSLAQRAHLSVRQLQRRIEERYGCGLAVLIQRIRLQEAQRLLSECTLGLERIAAHCGYHSADAMSRAFLRHVGMRPSDWRARFAARAAEDQSPVMPDDRRG